MRVRILAPRSGLEGVAGDVIEVNDSPGRALVAGGWVEETTAKVGPYTDPEPKAPEPEPEPTPEPTPEPEVEAEAEEDVGDTGTGNYEDRTRLQLVQLARTKGIKNAARMQKAELIEALRG